MPVTKPGKGDDLLRHAHKHGVSKRAVLSHPENRELFTYRDPGVLSEHDEVFVPDPAVHKVTVGMGETHYLVYKPERRILHLEVRDDRGQPRQADYVLSDFVYDGDKPKYAPPFPDQLYGFSYQGLVHEELPIALSALTLTFDDAPDQPVAIHLGRLDPVSSTRGLKRRLQNLGLYHGDVESADSDHELAEAIRAFQRSQNLAVSGAADTRTRDRLREVCGG